MGCKLVGLDQYIVCTDNCTLRQLESLAMVGLACDARVEQCSSARLKRLHVELFNGLTVSSSCFLDEEVELSLRIVKTYIEFARRNDAIGRLRVLETTTRLE